MIQSDPWAARQVTPRALKIIRAALLMGILIFGGVIWYLHLLGPRPPLADDTRSMLSIVFLVLFVTDVAMISVIRLLQSRTLEYQQKAMLAIVAWALAEGLALFGGVIYLLTAQRLSYLIGTAVLILSFLLVPAPAPPREEPRM